MKLSELVKSKKKENGLKWADFQEAGIHAQTYDNILHDKQKNMKPATMEKLARVLKCSIGEIQACLAEVPNPLREEAERQEGTAGINITARAVKIKKDEVDKVMREKPYVAPEPEPEQDEPMPEYHSVYKEDRDAGRQEYISELKDLLVDIMAQANPNNTLSADVFAVFGKAVIDKLQKE